MDHSQRAIESLLDEEWGKSQENPIIAGLRDKWTLKEIVSPNELEGAYTKYPKKFGCVDGRDPDRDAGLAGLGVLLPAVEKARLASILAERGIEEVRPHFDCGAGKKYYNMHIENGGLPTRSHLMLLTSDELTKREADLLAAQAKIPSRFLEEKDLACRVHNERMVIIAAARLRPAEIKKLPPYFLSSGFWLGLSDKSCLDEAELCIEVAFEHGFGDRFNADNPLYIVIVANDLAHLVQLSRKIGPFLRERFNEDRISIHGLYPYSSL